MKLFWLNELLSRNTVLLLSLPLFLLFESCATHSVQLGKATMATHQNTEKDSSKTIHTLYLIGDAGNADDTQTQQTLSLLEAQLKTADKNSTLLFLGDNIYPLGMPADKNNPEYPLAEVKLKNQLKITDNYKGKSVFIPGNHDWYYGIKGLQEQELFVNDYLKEKKSFLPRKSCGLDNLTINDNLALVIVDSQWFLEDWDKQPTINDNCEIKTRDKFFDEFESLINKNQNKTTIVVIHHPLLSNGPHGGQFSWEKQLYPSKSRIPVPVLGSFINLLRKTSGISPQDLQNKQYSALINRIKPMIQNRKNIIFVSGHEHNLQYIEHDGIKQIISGSASKREAARAIYPTNFSFGGNGFATLKVKENGSSEVTFFSTENNQEKVVFNQTIIQPEEKAVTTFPKTKEKSITATIYPKKSTQKNGFYKFFWGDHYRDYYGKEIEAPVVYLDTLYGGLQPSIAGGGHQSLSLRLKDKNGKEYVMRALKKSASRFLQTVAFKDQNVENEFKNKVAEQFIYDYYTTAHPYTPFIIGDLADNVGVYHSNPKLFYIPKQAILGHYNEDYGDALYMIEERPTDEHNDLESFGKPDAIISSDDVLANLRKDEKYSVDEVSYIRARLFDMLIGDWDRHLDQWRWAEYKISNDKVVYKPIPRDRDQAFAKIDGNLLRLFVNIPAARHMTSFKNKMPDLKWFNFAANALDLAFIKQNDSVVWQEQARYIVENLSDKAIDDAFSELPKEINNDATTAQLRENLKARKLQLEDYAIRYHHLLEKKTLLLGTDKKDKFVIVRLPNGKTKIAVSRIKKDGELALFSKEYDKAKTKEIWIYGLDDDDIFEVTGHGDNPIFIRLIGGQNNDSYTIENGKKIKIHDFKSKENTIKAENTAIALSDDYELNEYYYKRPTFNATMFLPSVGFNPDDGVKLGAAVSYTKYGFVNNPYEQKHGFKGNYYFATGGFELFYTSIFTKVVGTWNFEIDARYTTPNFSINYFGYGNETENYDDDDALGMDYNRVKIQLFKVAPSLRRIGKNGSDAQVQLSFENIEVEKIDNRFINLPGIVNPDVFNYQQFAGVNFRYSYENYDNISNPTMGMTFSVLGSWKTNLSDFDRNFPYLEGAYGISHKVSKNGKLVLGTLLKGKAVLNNNYEFYQGATLGGDYDLRGFRTQRFLGKQSFYQSTDLRWNIGKIRQSLIPMSYGILGGYDYGRVWLDGETSNKWHQSIGGGIWLNGLNSLTARLTYFNSADGNRVAFGLGFGF